MVSGALTFGLTLILWIGAGVPANASTYIRHTQVFYPTDEAFVGRAHPATNYAGDGLEAQGTHPIRSYLKYRVAGISGEVVRATLALAPEQSSEDGFSTYAATSNAWSEPSLTWSNAPPLEAAPLDDSGPYVCVRPCRVRADVSSTVEGEGIYTFAIASDAYPYDSYASKQDGASSAPRLVVTTRTETSEPPAEEPPAEEPPATEGWSAVGAKPLSDAAAAALVVHRPEQRPGNVTANKYVPSAAQISAFRAARNQYGQTAVQFNPLNAYVDGLDGLANPSTDDIIQWAARKWGIPVDWLRAQYVQESYWRQSQLGDRTAVSALWYVLYPLSAQLPGGLEVYESMGISQVKWRPDNSIGTGAEPLRWLSTAFNADYQAAMVRYYYDGYCGWCGAGYAAGQKWNSIGAWFSPSPWANGGAQSYVASVQAHLAERPWTSPGF